MRPGWCRAAWVQVAEFAVEHDPAIGHHPWGQGQVVVGRQVQVDRLLVVEAIAPGHAHRRVQQAGLATVVDRELEPGHVQERDIAHPQHRVAGHAEALVAVHVDLLRAQFPHALVRGAGTVGGVVHAPERAGQLDRVGAAVAAPVHQLVTDVADGVGVGALVALGTVGDDADARVLVADVAFGLVGARFRIHLQPVGAQELVATNQGDVAVDQGHGPGAALGVALDHGGLVVAGRIAGPGRGWSALERRNHVAGRAQCPVQGLVVIGHRHAWQAGGDAQGQRQQAQGNSHGGKASGQKSPVACRNRGHAGNEGAAAGQVRFIGAVHRRGGRPRGRGHGGFSPAARRRGPPRIRPGLPGCSRPRAWTPAGRRRGGWRGCAVRQ